MSYNAYDTAMLGDLGDREDVKEDLAERLDRLAREGPPTPEVITEMDRLSEDEAESLPAIDEETLAELAQDGGGDILPVPLGDSAHCDNGEPFPILAPVFHSDLEAPGREPAPARPRFGGRLLAQIVDVPAEDDDQYVEFTAGEIRVLAAEIDADSAYARKDCEVFIRSQSRGRDELRAEAAREERHHYAWEKTDLRQRIEAAVERLSAVQCIRDDGSPLSVPVGHLFREPLLAALAEIFGSRESMESLSDLSIRPSVLQEAVIVACSCGGQTEAARQCPACVVWRRVRVATRPE